MGWFLYDNGLRHERVNFKLAIFIRMSFCQSNEENFSKEKFMNHITYVFTTNPKQSINFFDTIPIWGHLE